ncbi:MAG: exo 1,3/1,4-beta-D-glucan glucohydrolase [Luteimonas sp.]|nr:exo 1,3/1,4-beta-D-glucan glucohydrolase [Luteimonas sp.]
MTASRSIATTLAIALLCACNQQSPTTTTQDEAAPKAAAGVAHPELWPKSASPDFKDAETEAFVGELLAKMSLEEKVGQMIQGDTSSVRPEDLRKYPLGSILSGGNSPPLGAPDRSPVGPWIDTARAYRAVSLEQREGHVPIPVLFGIDAVHGNNNVIGAVIYPHNIALGAANDPALMRRIGVATAAETAAAGFDWAFGPTLAVPQNDGWGRAYEGYSEDPNLVRRYAGEMVRGLQGEPGTPLPLQHGHVAASPKHFLGDGGTQGGIDQGDNTASEADLIRIHAAGYPAAIEAGTMTVMASFSSWQGAKLHGNRSLLTEVLKGRLGFEGFVVGDWNGHGQIPGCSNESCAATFNAGLDMAMAPDSWKGLYENLLAQARSGEVPMTRIDDAVRRILRVKYRLGLFDPARPWEGMAGVIGSDEHRALAREAVRKSLVLLKNNGGVLPLAASAKVLVAGSGADDISQQSGGWTLSWQGIGNQRSDFPNAQTIFEGLRDAFAAGGGRAELSVDGAFKQRPDVAIVVYGETPYAEFMGDVQTLEYQPGDKRDLALLKKLKAQGIPVVSVFLSGRPMWVNPELNASDAFVAAWLPGTEGGGVGDVLVAGADGKPRHDFGGRLSFSWPRTAAQLQLNKGDADYDPLFPLGYGLTYAQPATVPMLPEISGVNAATTNAGNYYVNGRTPPPWQLVLRQDGKMTPVAGNSADSAGGAVSLRATDANGVQEGGRRLRWNGSAEAAVAIVGNAEAKPLDLERQANGEVSLQWQYRVDRAPQGPVTLVLGCGANCRGAVEVTSLLTAAPAGQWRSAKIRLDCFRKAGAKLSNVVEPFVLSTASALELSIAEVRLVADPAGAVCPTP